MALLKSKLIKGVEHNYHKILKSTEDYTTGKTLVRIYHYPSKEVRDASVANENGHEAIWLEGTDLTRAEQYTKICESKLVQDTDEDGKPKVDDNGDPIMVETNWWVDAESDI